MGLDYGSGGGPPDRCNGGPGEPATRYRVPGPPLCVARRQVQRDYATALGVVAILLGLMIISGITHTYMTRPALIEAAAKPVPDTRRLFEATFR
jgi:hypothetical protein